MLDTLRQRVRTTVPFSEDMYALAVTRSRMIGSRRRVRELLAGGREIRLDLGGGYQPGRNGWINVDVAREADLFWDLRYGIPFPDGSVHALYSSHLFEHLTYSQGQMLLAECLRTLRPGGTFSIVVPNARLYLEAYLLGTDLPDDYFGWRPAFHGTTAIDAVNYVAYMAGEHRYMFDSENLLHRLRTAGFADVRQRQFDPLTDLPERDYESIYAIGTKPDQAIIESA